MRPNYQLLKSWCVITPGFQPFHTGCITFKQRISYTRCASARNLATQQPTEAMKCVPQIIIFPVVYKGIGHKREQK